MDIDKKILKFKEKIEEIYPSESQDIFKALSEPLAKAFWIYDSSNTKKVLQSLESDGYKIQDTSIPDVFIANSDNSLQLSRSNVFLEKQIYIQELSSLLPTLVLDLKANENILDLCASPGSKTLFLNHLITSKANIFANEIDRKRFFKMKENFNSYGTNNINLLNFDGTKLGLVKPEFINYFDRILVDVPCSSENTLNFYNTDSFKFWNYKKYKSFIKVQRKLLFSAFEMLKPGGTLVYSTCTYSLEENEGIVDSLLNEYGENVEIEDIQSQIEKFGIYKIQSGFTESKKKFSTNLAKSLRILPNQNARSFFLCKIRKVFI